VSGRAALLVAAAFLSEGTLTAWLLPEAWADRAWVVPAPLLVVLVYVAIYVHRYEAMAWGFAAGLLQDVVYYGHAVGVRAFGLAAVAYAAGALARWVSRPTMVVTLAAVFIGCTAFSLFEFGVYRFWLRTSDVPAGWWVVRHGVPSALFNAVFALAVYLPFRRFLERSRTAREEEGRG